MTAAAFRCWLALMKETKGWRASDAAGALGCGVNQTTRWSRNGAPHYVALACTALALGVPAWQRELDP